MRIIRVFGVALVCLAATAGSGWYSASIRANSDDVALDLQQKMPAGVQARKLDSGKTVLADAKGMTLYTFAKDAPGKSACSGNCAKNWPPLAAPADAKPMGDWTIVTRDDGSTQWAYKGQPLYGWVKDSKPGETTGDGVGGGSWRVAVP
jgi:predicted lipoprotein with Yx(FWY)xxD motif